MYSVSLEYMNIYGGARRHERLYEPVEGGMSGGDTEEKRE